MRFHTLSPVCLVAALVGQVLQPGYVANVRALPNGAGATCILDATRTVYFTGTKLVLDDGIAPRDLLTLPAFAFASFTIAVTPNTLLFGENSTGGLWLVPLNAPPRQLTTLAYNYDAVAWQPGLALVSAKTGGLASTTTEVWAVDLTNGATDLVIELAGASGPLVLDAVGDLLYASASTVFPPPPGGCSILRFAQSKLVGALGPTKLGLADASVVATGLDSAGDLALDRDRDLFVLDWWNSRLLEIDDVDAPRPRTKLLCDFATAANSPAALQMLPGRPATLAVFEPFQPEGAGALVVQESSFTTGASALRTIVPTRPQLLVSVPNPIPPGPVTLEVRGGPAHATALLVLGASGPTTERAIALVGTEQPILWGTALVLGQELATFPLVLDATGSARVPFVNPGGPALAIGAQVAFVDLPALLFGSTPYRVLDLR